MHNRTNSITRYTAWTAATHHGGLVRTMAEIQADQERSRRAQAYRSYFTPKDVCCKPA